MYYLIKDRLVIDSGNSKEDLLLNSGYTLYIDVEYYEETFPKGAGKQPRWLGLVIDRSGKELVRRTYHHPDNWTNTSIGKGYQDEFEVLKELVEEAIHKLSSVYTVAIG